jgi:hypothetical protein
VQHTVIDHDPELVTSLRYLTQCPRLSNAPTFDESNSHCFIQEPYVQNHHGRLHKVHIAMVSKYVLPILPHFSPFAHVALYTKTLPLPQNGVLMCSLFPKKGRAGK